MASSTLPATPAGLMAKLCFTAQAGQLPWLYFCKRVMNFKFTDNSLLGNTALGPGGGEGLVQDDSGPARISSLTERKKRFCIEQRGLQLAGMLGTLVGGVGVPCRSCEQMSNL